MLHLTLPVKAFFSSEMRVASLMQKQTNLLLLFMHATQVQKNLCS